MDELLSKATVYDFGGGMLVSPMPNKNQKRSFMVALEFEKNDEALKFVVEMEAIQGRKR